MFVYSIFNDKEFYRPFWYLGVVLLCVAVFLSFFYVSITFYYTTDFFQASPPKLITILGIRNALIVGGVIALYFWYNRYYKILSAHHIALKEYLDKKYVLLEIKISKQHKNPFRAMQLFLETFENGENGRFMLPDMASLEMESKGGVIRMFIRIDESVKQNILTSLYAYFPDATVTEEVNDYVYSSAYDKEMWRMFSCEYRTDNNDAYPLHTYIDAKLDNIKDRSTTDPVASLFEFFNSLRGGEHAWIHFVFVKEGNPRFIFPKSDSTKLVFGYAVKESMYKYKKNIFSSFAWKKEKYKDAFKRALTSETKDAEKNKEKGGTGKDIGQFLDHQKRLEKQPIFHVGIRFMYMAPKEEFRDVYVGSFAKKSFFKGVVSPFNSIIPDGRLLETYPFNKGDDAEAIEKEKEILLNIGRDRMYFLYPSLLRHQSEIAGWVKEPVGGFEKYIYDFLASTAINYNNKPELPRVMIRMSSEMLATLFHFANAVTTPANAPSVEAKTAEPPLNLPH
ncbi:MAG: hypothetical protein QM526_01990 [Alphaproteobacteria bacterium]|nr:hypothetical protein [Alphaproteobacteria bacterium]